MPEAMAHPDLVPPAPPRWRDAWQAPALALAAATLAGAMTWSLMTAPKADHTSAFEKSRALLAEAKYGEALESLNTKVRPLMAGDSLTPDPRREFYVLRARALFLGQRELGLDRRENHESIVREYHEAEKLHAELAPADATYLAQTLLALGEWDAAVARARGLPEASASDRREIERRAVEASLAARPPAHGRAMDLLTELAADPGLTRDERVWVLARQARILLATGYPDDAITKIVRTLPRLEGADPGATAGVLTTLARAYMSEGAMPEAGKMLDRARAMVGEDDALVPEITLLRAEIDHHEGDLSGAREGYREVLENYAFAEGRAGALLGLAEVESAIHNASSSGPPEEAAARYAEVVELVLAGEPTGDATVERVSGSLMARFREQYDRRDYATALKFATLAERVGGDTAPADVVLAVADASLRTADAILEEAGRGGSLSLAEADPATQREAKEHLLQAGDAYRRHAQRVLLTDNARYGESLWAAADAFDRAGDLELCVGTFQQFASEFPGDPRRPEALFRLAQAHRARGDLELASRLYQELVDLRGLPDGSGPFGDRSVVPLATTLLHDQDETNDARAEGLLTSAISGEVTGPDTPIFREALRELGEHQLRTRAFAPAIERLEQYLALAPSEAPDPGDTPVRFRLAEANRLSAAEIAQALQGGLSDREQRELEARRARRLARAMALYEEVKASLEVRPRRSALDDVTLRNAYFYAADCAFDAQDYDGAIRLYDAARERYPKDPASLVAMTQVVGALLAKGERAKAAIANQRARRFFESLPETAWDDPTLPMSRRDWERWLDAQDNLLAGGARTRTRRSFEGD